MSGRAMAFQDTCGTADQRACADGKQRLSGGDMILDKSQDRAIVHLRLLARTARNLQQVERRGVRKQDVRHQGQAAVVAKGAGLRTDDVNLRVGKTRQHFKGASEVDLVHIGEDQNPNLQRLAAKGREDFRFGCACGHCFCSTRHASHRHARADG
jgi:hypothetical protein